MTKGITATIISFISLFYFFIHQSFELYAYPVTQSNAYPEVQNAYGVHNAFNTAWQKSLI